jgi:LDH2 family malate/lactate/ureidoglycolate dehydrogenase
LVDIFSGVLAGSGFGEEVLSASGNQPTRVGHFFAAIKIDAFREIDAFKHDMDQLLNELRNSPKAEGESASTSTVKKNLKRPSALHPRSPYL